MFKLFITLFLSSFFVNGIEHSVDNNCDFEIIRFKKYTVKCVDHGKFKNYCGSDALPYEFVVKKEKGLFYVDHFEFEPKRMVEETSNNKFIMTNFAYDFQCDSQSNSPKLTLHIYPTQKYDKDLRLEVIFFLIILVILLSICACCYNGESDEFWLGYILGSLSNNSNSSRRYSE